jgi:copper homeostasis protein
MVRPRIGDFVYSESELLVMRHDIETFKRLGVLGVVLGVLDSHSEVDVSATTRYTKLNPLPRHIQIDGWSTR